MGEGKKLPANYNEEKMSFDITGKTFTLTITPEVQALPEHYRHQLLVGIRNSVIDSVASLTIKGGSTPAKRLEEMRETLSRIEAGTYSKERAATTMVRVSTDAITKMFDEILAEPDPKTCSIKAEMLHHILINQGQATKEKYAWILNELEDLFGTDEEPEVVSESSKE